MQLLERESYIEELSAVFGRIPCVGGRVVLISGEAGIGKTSLLRELAATLDKTARVLWGGCEALFTPHPLAPLQDISRQIGGDFPKAICAAAGRHEIFNATLDQLARLSAPTVVVIEDAHWADAATLDLIKFLGRRLAGLGVMLVVSYRDDEVNDKHPLRSVIGDLPPASLCRIRLQPLSEGAVEQLAAAAGRSSAGLHEITNGNPFFVTEVLAASDEKVPSTVRDAVIARLARLSEEARRVAHLVSIVPRHAERWLIDGMIGPGGEVMQECLNAGMIAHRDCSLGFRHEIARRAVEDSMSLPERQDLHAGALAMLLKQREGKVAIARLVHHADNAADSAAVLRFAPVAAERAAALGAHREAAGHLRTALRHTAALGASFPDEERARLLEQLSYECYLTDEMADASVAREKALAVWRSLGLRRKEGDALRWLSRLSLFNGRKVAAEGYASEAVTVLEQLPAGRELAMAYSNCSQLQMLAENVVAIARVGTQGARARHPSGRDRDRGACPHQHRHSQAGGRRSCRTRRSRTGAGHRVEQRIRGTCRAGLQQPQHHVVSASRIFGGGRVPEGRHRLLRRAQSRFVDPLHDGVPRADRDGVGPLGRCPEGRANGHPPSAGGADQQDPGAGRPGPHPRQARRSGLRDAGRREPSCRRLSAGRADRRDAKAGAGSRRARRSGLAAGRGCVGCRGRRGGGLRTRLEARRFLDPGRAGVLAVAARTSRHGAGKGRATLRAADGGRLAGGGTGVGSVRLSLRAGDGSGRQRSAKVRCGRHSRSSNGWGRCRWPPSFAANSAPAASATSRAARRSGRGKIPAA